MTKKLTLGFSPCPNDTFMFDAMVNGKIDTGGLSFDVRMEDIETLNQKALKGELDITKISFALFPNIVAEYQLLTSGSALGHGVGPLLISKKEFSDPQNEIRSVAIPGKNTTAYNLFKKFYPKITSIKEIVFSEIEDAVLMGKVDAGVIIHENRFTYFSKGLKKIADLGDLWEKETKHPIPLGGIIIKRNLDSVKNNINTLIKKSIEFAFNNPEKSKDYIKSHSQEMDDDIIQKHISLYVNNFSVDLGIEGKEAIMTYFGKTITGDFQQSVFI